MHLFITNVELKVRVLQSRESVWDLLACLQDAVQVVQQWPFHTGKAQNHVSVQSMRLDSSRTRCGVLERHWLQSVLESQRKKSVPMLVKKCRRSRIDGLARGYEAREAKIKVFFFHVFLYGPPNQRPRFGVGLPASNNLVRESSQGCPSRGFQLMLTTEVRR